MSFLKSSSAASRLSAPSPTPSNSSSSGAKRKRPVIEDATPGTVWSQPTETGTGSHLMTQVTYAIDRLRKANGPLSFEDLASYLSIPKSETELRRQLLTILRSPEQPRIQWDGKDQFRYKPKNNVRSAEQLKGFLQNQKAALGLSVKDLKDGWTDAAEAIEELERKKELLVTHNKKDGSARTVWINDPTLMHTVDPDFLNEWHKIPLPPNPDDLRNKLVVAGLKPSSAPKEVVASKPKEKKKKAPRRGGRQTNTHMASILKDYSHKRK